MKSCCEHLRGILCKLRMFVIQVEHLAYVFGANQSLLSNSSKTHSFLKKNYSRIDYIFAREGVTKNEWMTTYLNTHINPSEMCTKYLSGSEKRTRFASYFLRF